MLWVSRVTHFVRRLLHRDRAEQELDEEVRGYFEALVARGVAKGLTPAEAQRVARLQFEGPEETKQRVREAWVGAPLDATIRDIRHAWRSLRRSPGFTLFAVLTIALGLGANAAIFSLVDGVLLKSTRYPEPERIVRVWEQPPGESRNHVAPATFLDWAAQSHSFDAIAARKGGDLTYTGGAEPRALSVAFVSAPYFEVFGEKPALGRTFFRDEDQVGKEKVAVLSNRLWLELFGGDPGAVGRPIQLNGSSYTVVGVLPSDSPLERHEAQLFVPLAFHRPVARDYYFLVASARLKADVSIDQARAEMAAISASIGERYPRERKGWGVIIDRYLDVRVGPNLRTHLVVLMLSVASILLIGCVNLANLLMARSTVRSREIALRMALGASRWRVIRMLLVESLVLSAVGAVAGAAIGYGLLGWIQSLLPDFYLPAEARVAMDSRVFLFLAGASILTTLAFGLAPAIQAVRRDQREALREGESANSAGRGKVFARNAFVATQVALAFVLLVVGGLMLRSLHRVMTVDVGFRTEGIVAARLPLDLGLDPQPHDLIQYVGRVLEEVRAAPGIREAAIASELPLGGWSDAGPFWSADGKREPGNTALKVVTQDYFRTLGLRVVAGRLFDDRRDTDGAPPVLVVNESFVTRYSPAKSIIGMRILAQRLIPSRRGAGPEVEWEIVGVVADEKAGGLEKATDVGMYSTFLQSPGVDAGLGLVARVSGEPGPLIKTIQRAVWRVNKNQSLVAPTTVDDIKARSTMSRRLVTKLLTGFALLGMLLACTGIYGVLSLVTASRRKELGIRAALGASRRALVRTVVVDGARPVVVGFLVGMGAALVVARVIQSMLFSTPPVDAPSLFGVGALFSFVALAACLVPALRAASAEPMSVLRQE